MITPHFVYLVIFRVGVRKVSHKHLLSTTSMIPHAIRATLNAGTTLSHIHHKLSHVNTQSTERFLGCCWWCCVGRIGGWCSISIG